MRVSSDAVALFGFSSAAERSVFDRLVAVSGVGARLALSVLSTFSPDQLYTAVMAEDVKTMSKVPGVGKKTAQRLILELKSVFAHDRGLAAAATPLAGQMPLGTVAENTTALDDARAALLSMGFSPQETDLALNGLEATDGRAEDLLASALKRLGMGA